MKLTRIDSLFINELIELISKATPYALSTGSSEIHDFVKGLILATYIIEVIDKHLSKSTHIAADWGQIIDDRGGTFSKECDIILYKNTPYKEFVNKSMRYVLVNKKQAKAIIQVRSSITCVTKDDKKYCKNLRKFVPKAEVWYFAECCWARSKKRVKTLEDGLKKYGYKHFFYLYRMDDDSLSKIIDYEPFIKFVKLIKKLR